MILGNILYIKILGGFILDLYNSYQIYFKDSFNKRIFSFEYNFAICKKNPSEESIHDLRVSSRRLIASIDICINFFKNKSKETYKLLKYRKKISKILKSLSFLRDIQVKILFVKKHIDSFLNLNYYYEYLLNLEKKYKSITIEALKNTKIKKLSKKLKKINSKIIFTSTKKLSSLFNKKYNSLCSKLSTLDSNDVKTFHKARLSIKKLRYFLETSIDYINIDKNYLSVLQKYQSYFGEIQDLSVFIKNALYFQNSNQSINLNEYIAFLLKKREEKINTLYLKTNQLILNKRLR